jgi:hypothetical protein
MFRRLLRQSLRDQAPLITGQVYSPAGSNTGVRFAVSPEFAWQSKGTVSQELRMDLVNLPTRMGGYRGVGGRKGKGGIAPIILIVMTLGTSKTRIAGNNHPQAPHIRNRLLLSCKDSRLVNVLMSMAPTMSATIKIDIMVDTIQTTQLVLGHRNNTKGIHNLWMSSLQQAIT